MPRKQTNTNNRKIIIYAIVATVISSATALSYGFNAGLNYSYKKSLKANESDTNIDISDIKQTKRRKKKCSGQVDYYPPYYSSYFSSIFLLNGWYCNRKAILKHDIITFYKQTTKVDTTNNDNDCFEKECTVKLDHYTIEPLSNISTNTTTIIPTDSIEPEKGNKSNNNYNNVLNVMGKVQFFNNKSSLFDNMEATILSQQQQPANESKRSDDLHAISKDVAKSYQLAITSHAQNDEKYYIKVHCRKDYLKWLNALQYKFKRDENNKAIIEIDVSKNEKQEVRAITCFKQTTSYDIPIYWSMPVARYQLVQLNPDKNKLHRKEFNSVKKYFLSTVSKQYMASKKINSFKIVSIVRIQNPALWKQYYFCREHINKEMGNNKPIVENDGTKLFNSKKFSFNPDPAKANERYLFHGSSRSIIKKIALEGFDHRVASLYGMFGAGIYFAENASKSHNYTGIIDTCKAMLLCRVALGNSYVSLGSMSSTRKPPAPSVFNLYSIYHSIIGDSKKYSSNAALNFREFIIYDNQQAYPEYIIYYRTT